MPKIVLAYLFLLSLDLFFTVQALALLGIEPSLMVREEYDDNIFLSADDERSDFITTVNPNLALRWETRPFTLVLDYGFEFLFYRDHPEFDESSANDTQRARAEAEIMPGRKFSINVLDEYRRVPIDLRRPTVESNRIVNKTNVNRFLLNPRYKLGKQSSLQAILGYQYEKFTYDSPEGDDNDSHALTLDIARELSSRTELTVAMAQRFHQADLNEDFQRQDLVAGLNIKMGPRLILRGNGGMTWLDYKDNDEQSAGVWSVGVDLQITPRVSLVLDYNDNFLYSVDEGLAKTRLAEGSLGYAGRVKANLSVFAQEYDYQSVDREDRSAGGGLSLRIPVRERFELRLHGNLSYLEFLPEDNDVRRSSVGAALDYRRRFLTVSLGYDHHESTADLDADEYRSNIVFLAATVTLGRSLTDYQDSQVDDRLPFADHP